MYILELWIEHPVRSLDHTFTYLSRSEVQRGCRVSVVFGAKTLIGFADSCVYTDETEAEIETRLGFRIRFIDQVIDETPFITDELYDLAMKMREDTLSTAISCFQAMLPAKIKPRTTEHKILKERYVRLSDKEVSLTPKQLEAWLYVKEKGTVAYSELRKKYPNQARSLLVKGALDEFEEEKKGTVKIERGVFERPLLSPLQEHVLAEITDTDDTVYLLRGITGSGKTEIYLRLAENVLNEGRQVLILVPEIALTPQMIERVSSRFGDQLAIYHSGLSAQEKYEQYRMIMNHEAQVVVGTRSAVFLPFDDLGLIVMDEEHDPSYKQDNQPCYHCRDAAVFRAEYSRCKLILASATPTLESYARGLKNVYHLIVMDERINRKLPEVHAVNMKSGIRSGESYIISDLMKEKIQERLERGEQIILMLNRRGYHARLACRSCGEIIRCPHCDLAMSWHRDGAMLKCHTCGHQMKLMKVCPSCGSTAGWMPYGFGTEKLENEVSRLFPDARILRMDADTTTRKNSHERILKAFANHEADILLGTQMIAKGLDFPDVTLVGIVNGDDGLVRTDFRSCETTFDLLMQACGRSGRAEKEGEVVVQVYDPEHYAVKAALAQDYEAFFTNEMHYRHAGQYPPYTYLISVTFGSLNESETIHEAQMFMEEVKGDFKTIGVISLLRIHDLYRSRVILKGKNLDAMRTAVRVYMNNPDFSSKGLRIDVNPMYLE